MSKDAQRRPAAETTPRAASDARPPEGRDVTSVARPPAPPADDREATGTAPPPAPPADDFSAAVNAKLGGWEAAMGVRVVWATRDEVVAELRVGPPHRQAYGLVHGGVYAGLIELAASVGATIDAAGRGQLAVGLENHTSFLHAAREGTLRVAARPLSRGARTQVWEATVTDDGGRAVATGRVRLLALDVGAAVAGAPVAFEPPGA